MSILTIFSNVLTNLKNNMFHSGLKRKWKCFFVRSTSSMVLVSIIYRYLQSLQFSPAYGRLIIPYKLIPNTIKLGYSLNEVQLKLIFNSIFPCSKFTYRIMSILHISTYVWCIKMLHILYIYLDTKDLCVCVCVCEYFAS